MIGDFFNFNKNDEEKKEDNLEQQEVVSKKSQYVDEDPVEKMFNFFFGEKEEKPMGLARFGSERFPGEYVL